MKKLKITLCLFICFTSLGAYADLTRDLARLVGWTIIHAGQVTGYIDSQGKKKDAFEGCEYGRQLIIDYQYVVKCQTYSYSYAYNPDAVLLSKNGAIKLVVENEIYDVTR